MPLPMIDAERLEKLPLSSECSATRLDLSGTSASITLAAGGYWLTVAGMSAGAGCFARVGTAAVVPASGAALDAGFWLEDGATYTYQSDGTALHAILTTGTAILHATRIL